jgi:hypothetical protein
MDTNNSTYFTIVVDFNPNDNYLEDQILLGWDNDTDWFDHHTTGDEILTSNNTIKNIECGVIHIGDIGVYVSETQSYNQVHCELGNREGYDCTLCRLEKDSNEDWIVVPV